MSERKNIDRLFQERFKDFEANPPEIVWTNIEEALRKKKERRVIPIWFKLGGIAAALLIGLLLVNYLFFDKSSTEEKVAGETTAPVKVSDPAEKALPAPKVFPGGELPADMSDGIAAEQDGTKTGQSSDAEADGDQGERSQNINTGADRKAGSASLNRGAGSKTNNAVADSDEKSRSGKSRTDRRLKTTGTIPVAPSGIASTTENETQNKGIVQDLYDRKKREQKYLIPENDKITKDGQNTLNNITEEPPVAATQEDGKQNSQGEAKSVTSDKGTSEIAETATEKVDTTAIATVVPNALEELLKEKEKDAVTSNEQKVNRWQITSNVAPIYFSSASNGSPIDSRFAENSKSFKTSLSYGAGFQYSFNRRISVRSGVNAVGLEYSTNDVVFSQTPAAHGLANINSNIQGSLLQIENPGNFEELTLDGRSNKKFEGKLNQRIGYIEVPVELSYKILDKKFGVEIIGGVSTLFLNQNEISLETEGMEMEIGKANNLNDMHFSTNVGLGVKYNFLKSLQFKVEPILKYQINTFTNDAGNFKPYFFGIYSGLNYRF